MAPGRLSTLQQMVGPTCRSMGAANIGVDGLLLEKKIEGTKFVEGEEPGKN